MYVEIASVIVAALKDLRFWGFSGISALIIVILLGIHLLTRK